MALGRDELMAGPRAASVMPGMPPFIKTGAGSSGMLEHAAATLPSTPIAAARLTPGRLTLRAPRTPRPDPPPDAQESNGLQQCRPARRAALVGSRRPPPNPRSREIDGYRV